MGKSSIVAKTWAEYDQLLADYDSGATDVEPAAPEDPTIEANWVEEPVRSVSVKVPGGKHHVVVFEDELAEIDDLDPDDDDDRERLAVLSAARDAFAREDRLPSTMPSGPSERTEQRRRRRRKDAINAIVTRDGRATVESARDRVLAERTADDSAWRRVCDRCGEAFESRRGDARYCSTKCRVAAHRAARNDR